MNITESDPCAKCGMELRAGEPFCPHCGARRAPPAAPSSRGGGTQEHAEVGESESTRISASESVAKHTRSRILAWTVALAALLVYWSWTETTFWGPRIDPIGGCANPDATVERQAQFVRAMRGLASEFNSTNNELIHNRLRRRQDPLVERYIATGHIRCWLGRVERIDSHNDGAYVTLQLMLAEDGPFSLTIIHNSLLGAVEDALGLGGPIRRGTPLYNKIMRLNEGDWVLASFRPNTGNNLRWTERGQLLDPSFEVRFSDVIAITYRGTFAGFD